MKFVWLKSLEVFLHCAKTVTFYAVFTSCRTSEDFFTSVHLVDMFYLVILSIFERMNNSFTTFLQHNIQNFEKS